MKNPKYFLLLIIIGALSFVQISCKTPETKVEAAQEKVAEAREDLSEARQEASEEIMKAASAEEWRVFQNETEIKIKDTEARIDELKKKMKSTGRKVDAEITRQIDNLEFKVKELRGRVNNYEITRTDYSAFKREFNRDIDKLGEALQDFTVNNKL